MSLTSAILLPSTTASELLELPIESSKSKGCGYYGKNDALHTVQFITNLFKGKIIIQGSLEGKPTDDDWFDIDAASLTSLTPSTQNITKSFTGNFVWIRAVVTEFAEGNINRVLLSHN